MFHHSSTLFYHNIFDSVFQRNCHSDISLMRQRATSRTVHIIVNLRCIRISVGGGGGVTSYIWHSTDVRAE